ncbi:hypothetical protein AXG93_2515s1340 [Marchantia polymorpha subsp. ruderalis]|uniref:Uncharacterized protein n=1 Tax=Marchantia polymorpha subsp. ruderalis TaxID=1480154 RepID=A0A176W7S7_MARPO|nr:hypothetical protein AXG93_2515s1340 [Marchantia polymorpha subsp. ruderalis]
MVARGQFNQLLKCQPNPTAATRHLLDATSAVGTTLVGPMNAGKDGVGGPGVNHAQRCVTRVCTNRRLQDGLRSGFCRRNLVLPLGSLVESSRRAGHEPSSTLSSRALLSFEALNMEKVKLVLCLFEHFGT